MSPALQQHIPHITSAISNSICTLDHYGVISVSGDDARKFLQGQVTCDVEKISSQHASLGAFCNVQGRMHATFYLAQYDDQLLMILPREVIANTLKKLSMYAVFFQADLADVSDKFQLQGVFGAVRLETPKIDTPSDSFALTVSEQEQRLFISLATSQAQLVISPAELAPIEHLDDQQNKAPASSDYWNALEILLGIPMVLEATIEELLPHFVGLTNVNGVGFEKGCYTGQEVIARMHYRGTLKTHAVILHSTNSITEQFIGEPVLVHKKKAGQVINTAALSLNNADISLTVSLVSLSDKYADADSFDIAEHTFYS